MKILNVLWVEDVVKNQKAIWFNLQPEINSIGIDFEIDWQDSGRYASTAVRDKNMNNGKVGYEPNGSEIHLMLVDYNLDETLQDGQTSGIDGAAVIMESKLHDNELPILFYSSNPDADLNQLANGAKHVYVSNRDDIVSSIIRLLKGHF